MKFRITLLAAAASVGVSTCAAYARDSIIVHSGPVNAQGVAPKFAVISRLQPNIHTTKAPAFPRSWVYKYTYGGKSYPETFIGFNPTTGNTLNVNVIIVPIKMVYGSTSYDPTKVQANGVSIIQNVLNSPVFASSIDYVQGGTDLGTTQYLDAFQRATLWGTVSKHPTYHVLLTPHVRPVQTVTIAAGDGEIINAFGATNLILADINVFDPKILALITSLALPNNSLPLFIATQTYLSSNNNINGCCIGGYHSTDNNVQPYAFSTYITTAGAFAQNVGALSHEIGEWIDDPYIANAVPSACGAGAILEVGDPLETNANYGDYAYTVGGVTWDLQDLVLLPYFGAPTSISVNGWSTFQGETIGFCSNGG